LNVVDPRRHSEDVGDRSELLPFERLHAYAAGELNPAERAQVEAELESHPENRARLDRVHAMQGLLASAAPSEPDDLTWKRMQQRIQSELAKPSIPEESKTGIWLPIGIAAAAVIAAFLILGETKTESPAHEPSGPQVLASGSAPLDVTLASGTSLRLAPSSEVTVKSPEARPTELVLEVGELDVRSPVRVEKGEPAVTVRTPVYVAAASSLDFSVGVRTDGYFVEARDGEIAVEGEGFDEGTIVRAGERRTVQAKPAAPSRVEKILEESVTKIEVPKRKATKKKIVEAPAREVKESSEGETSVQIVLEESDPIKRKWLEAALAYYERRDLPAAIELARRVVAEAPHRAEGRMAEVMLCEALIATGRAAEAIEACEARLRRPHTEEEKREIHFLLATIHHRQLGDCSKAIDHYGQAMVFGGTSLLDDRVRLFRAACALEIGRIDLATVDLTALERRRNRLPNPEELDRLRERLVEAMRGGGRK
jgi:hypothetical protein